MSRLIVIFILLFSSASLATIDSVEDLQALVVAKKYVSAIKAGKRLLKHRSQWPDVQFLTAYAYQMNKQPERAATIYRSLITSNPELPEPRNNLAIIYQAKGDYDAASQLLVEAIETHQSYATAYQNLSRIYTGIASEAYRRALSESAEPAKYTHKIELAALSRLGTAERKEQPGELESTLSAQIKQWAKAWSNKDFATYTSFYSTEHRPNFKTHKAWVEHRRRRIIQSGVIKIGVSDFQIFAQDSNQVIIDFKQSFDSQSYSDRVVKRLGFQRVGTQWKIIDESVLSILLD